MTHRLFRPAIATALAIGVLAALVTAAPATADPLPTPDPPPTPTSPGSGVAQHCVVKLTAYSSEPGVAKCFHTFPEAISFATGGRLVDVPLSPAEAVDDPAFAAHLAAGANGGPVDDPKPKEVNVVLSIEYEHINFNAGAFGSSNTFVGDKLCDAATDIPEYAQPDLRNSLPQLPNGANDLISSFRTYSNCNANHYEHVDFGGAATGYWTTRDYIGDDWNDKASSISWS